METGESCATLVMLTPLTGAFACVRAPAIAPGNVLHLTDFAQQRQIAHTSSNSEPGIVVCPPKTSRFASLWGLRRTDSWPGQNTRGVEVLNGGEFQEILSTCEFGRLCSNSRYGRGHSWVVLPIDGGSVRIGRQLSRSRDVEEAESWCRLGSKDYQRGVEMKHFAGGSSRAARVGEDQKGAKASWGRSIGSESCELRNRSD